MPNYFSDSELKCKCGNGCEFVFSDITRERLNEMRSILGFAIKVNSGHRCEEYNILIGATQTHASGQAVDIAATHKEAYAIVKLAPSLGFTGVGLKQHTNPMYRFIHLDDLDEELPKRPRPHIWTYS